MGRRGQARGRPGQHTEDPAALRRAVGAGGDAGFSDRVRRQRQCPGLHRGHSLALRESPLYSAGVALSGRKRFGQSLYSAVELLNRETIHHQLRIV